MEADDLAVSQIVVSSRANNGHCVCRATGFQLLLLQLGFIVVRGSTSVSSGNS